MGLPRAQALISAWQSHIAPSHPHTPELYGLDFDSSEDKPRGQGDCSGSIPRAPSAHLKHHPTLVGPPGGLPTDKAFKAKPLVLPSGSIGRLMHLMEGLQAYSGLRPVRANDDNTARPVISPLGSKACRLSRCNRGVSCLLTLATARMAHLYQLPIPHQWGLVNSGRVGSAFPQGATLTC